MTDLSDWFYTNFFSAKSSYKANKTFPGSLYFRSTCVDDRRECEFLCSSARCHFPQRTPKHLRSSSFPPRSLKHGCQCNSCSHLIPTCLGLQTDSLDLLAQFPALHGGTRLGTEVERLQWGPRGGRGRMRGHIWTDISFHSFLSSHFLLIVRVPSARPAWSEVRGDIQSADKYWKWQLIILRGEDANPCCEVCF